MRRARFETILLLALALGGCALLEGHRAGVDPRGLALKQRGATVVIALERYRAANGRLPAHLFELLPKYLPQLPDGLATDYRPDEKKLAFSYQASGSSITTTCEITIGHRAWDCHDSL
ncbi:MAG TPA: hypothetical protein VG387_07145 [Rhizomicrobium sp.]|jgi:hypothetical protein|nr:hypothetical protein [Rhizomicrobium sp.]